MGSNSYDDSINGSLRNMAIRHINDAIKNDSLIVFLGAGASMNSGLPSWDSLITELREDLAIEDSPGNNLKIAQYYYDMVGQQKYFQKIDDIFLKYQNAKPNEIHEEIERINPKHIITTNYDSLIEKQVNSGINKYQIVNKDMDIPYSKSDHYLIKMHGDLFEKNVVLKEDDYFDYEKNFYMISTLIKSLIMNHTVLFIGYSLNDSTFNSIFRLIQQGFSGNAKHAFFLSPEPKEYALIEYYKNKGIRVFSGSDQKIDDKDIGPTIVKFLKQLSSDFNRRINSSEELWQEISFFNQLSFVDPKMLVGYLNKFEGAFYLNQNVLHYTKQESLNFSIKDQQPLINFLNEKTSFTNFFDFERDNNTHFVNNSILENAYKLYLNRDFDSAQIKFQQIANNAFAEKDYWNYLIASFNVSHILSNDTRTGFKVSEKLSDVVDKLISSGSVPTKKLALFFRDEILNFNFIYKKLFSIDKLLDRIKIENNTFKHNGASFNNYFADLQWEFENLIQFINLNCITVHQYQEFQEVVNRYFECLLIAYSNYEIGNSVSSEFANASSFIKELTIKEVQNIVTHLDSNEIDVLLENYELTKINITDEAFKYLVDEALSILNKTSITVLQGSSLFTKYINFISFSSINNIDRLIDLLEFQPSKNKNFANTKRLLIILNQEYGLISSTRYDDIVKIISNQLTDILLTNDELQKKNISLYALLLDKIKKSTNDDIGFLKLTVLEEKLCYIESKLSKAKAIEQLQVFISNLYSFLVPSTKKLIDNILKQYDEINDSDFNYSFAKQLIFQKVFSFPLSKDRIINDSINIPSLKETKFKSFPDERHIKIIDLCSFIKMKYFDVSTIKEKMDISNFKNVAPEFDWMFFDNYSYKNVQKLVEIYGIKETIHIFADSIEKQQALNDWIIKQAQDDKLKLVSNGNIEIL